MSTLGERRLSLFLADPGVLVAGLSINPQVLLEIQTICSGDLRDRAQAQWAALNQAHLLRSPFLFFSFLYFSFLFANV
jgi:hypothetical protein